MLKTNIVYITYLYAVIFFLQKRVNHHFEMVFEMGVDEMSWDDTVSQVDFYLLFLALLTMKYFLSELLVRLDYCDRCIRP